VVNVAVNRARAGRSRRKTVKSQGFSAAVQRSPSITAGASGSRQLSRVAESPWCRASRAMAEVLIVSWTEKGERNAGKGGPCH
jgi:hypothetical protein